MTTMTMETMTMETPESLRRLEELVDRLLSAVLDHGASADADSMPRASLVRGVHQARRLRQAAGLDGALAVLANVDTRQATDGQLRWLYAEWLDIARRRFAGDDAVLYSPATGRAAVLVPTGGDNATLEATAVLGMRWPVGKVLSRRSLRGLKPLRNKNNKGGSIW